MPNTHSSADTLTRKNLNFTNKTVNSGEETSSIKNSHGSSIIHSRETRDKERSKHKKKKLSHVDCYDDGVKGKSDIQK